MSEAVSRQTALEKRLEPYWKMEAGNVLLIPAITLFATLGEVSWATLLGFVPVCFLLVIGAYYWRAKPRFLQANEPLEPSVELIAKWQWPSLILTLIAVTAAGIVWVRPELSAGLADRIAATVMAALASLAYVNYYHRQVQHFDHAADFKRLLSGKGFRKSQLRRDMERFGLR